MTSLLLSGWSGGCATETHGIAESESALTGPTATFDATNVYVHIPISSAPQWVRVFFDTDLDETTGYSMSGVGAELLVENGNLYRFSGSSSTTWAWTPIKSVPNSVGAQLVQVTVPRADLGSPAAVNLITQTTPPMQTSSTITLSLACGGAPPPPPPPASDAGAPPAEAGAPPDAGALPFAPPALINPVSPLQFGAKCDGVTDDSAAFQQAVNAGDVKVPAATCVINHTVNVTMSDRHIECSPGATLRQTDGFAGKMLDYVSWSNQTLTGDSIVNCVFVGANTVAPQYYDNDNRHWNIPVETQDRVSNFLLAGNTFQQFFGQSMFQTYGAVDGGSGDKIIYNTFKSCGLYGPVFVAHKNGYIAHNTLVDCALGVENDDATQVTGGNVIEYNTLTAAYGYGAPDMGASAFLTGGATIHGEDYSTNIVRNNSVSGVSSAAGFQGARPSKLIIGAGWGAKAAQYSNNTCTNGCEVVP